MLCLSLYGNNAQEILKNAAQTQVAEVRLDLSRLSNEDIKTVFLQGKSLIATCRSTPLYDIDMRVMMLKTAIENGAKYVDLDIESEEYPYLYEIIKSKGCKLIISYHNYEYTPEYIQLKDIVEASCAMKADIVKIACYAKSKNDIKKILPLYDNYSDIIAFLMGEFGTFSRVASYFLDAPLCYVAKDEESKTALGQLTLSDMKKIIDIVSPAFKSKIV